MLAGNGGIKHELAELPPIRLRAICPLIDTIYTSRVPARNSATSLTRGGATRTQISGAGYAAVNPRAIMSSNRGDHAADTRTTRPQMPTEAGEITWPLSANRSISMETRYATRD